MTEALWRVLEVLAVPKNMKLLAIPLFELYDNAARWVYASIYAVCSCLTIHTDTGLNYLPSLISSLGVYCHSGAVHAQTCLRGFLRYNFIYQ